MANWSAKDPGDERDYWIDFRPIGLAEGETLTSATVTAPEDQLDPVDPYEVLSVLDWDIALDDVWVVARFAGGSPGPYQMHYEVTTSTGQKLNLDKTLSVKERVQR